MLATRWTYRWPDLTVRGDFGTFKGPMLLAAVGNTSRYRGGIRMTLDAKPDDRLLDCCIIRRRPKLEVLRMLPRAVRGAHDRHPAVSIEQTTQVQLDAEPSLWLWAAGERVARTPTTIRMVPQAFWILGGRAGEQAT